MAPGLLVEHLLHQIVGNGPLISGEGADEAHGIRVTAQRKRRQAESADPALRASVQLVDLLVGELQAGHREQLPGLWRGERQVGGAQLGELALEPQPLQREAGVQAAGDDQTQPALRAAQKPIEALGDLL